MANLEIDRNVARQAAHWLMLLHSGEADEQQLRECECWRRADPEHERAWQRVALVQQRFGLLPPELAMGALGRERRQALKSLLVLTALAPLGYAGYRVVDRQQWLANQRTSIGEQRSLTLEDGSRLSLNSDSAVDLLFTAEQRLIRLRAGEIFIDTGVDSGHPGYRPLRVVTDQGLLQALGTRFLVRLDDPRALTRLAVFDGAVRIQPQTGVPLTITAGQQVSFASGGAGPLSRTDENIAAWVRGQVIAEDMPLGEFIMELARHRAGWLRCMPEVASLRISGTFQLASTDAILAALPDILPVKVESHTRYWVTVRTLQ